MKLLKSKSLYFKDAKSDKVYEVDLCEIDSELFVVNFRYGRREKSLREGTKTVFPVPYEEAIIVFNKLVKSKEDKGYAEEGKENTLIEKLEIQQNDHVNTARKEVILGYLKDATLANYIRDWKVSRIIWRTGELNITEAVKYLSHFIGSENDFEQYAAIKVLTKFRDLSVIDKVDDVFYQKGLGDKVGRIAATYLLNSSKKDDPHLKKLFSYIIKELPESIANSIANPQELQNKLTGYFLQEKIINPQCLYYLYLLSYQEIALRAILLVFVKSIPLKVNTFKPIRYIFRAAEEMNDLEFYAVLSKKIAVSKPGYNGYGTYDAKWNWINADEEKKKPNPRIAFSAKTKQYFGNTTYKRLYQFGATDVDNYVDFAKKTLCLIDDSVDKEREEIQYFYNYDSNTRQYETIKKHYPKYCSFPALMYILYGNSERFHRTKNKWYYTEILNTSQLPREEALPEVWNSKPQEVLYILAHAKSEEAIHFALRIIQDKPEFLNDIPSDIFKKLIIHYDIRVVETILNVLEIQFETKKPEEVIILALLKSNSEKAQALGLQWLQKYESEYMVSSDFIAMLVLIEKDLVIKYLTSLYETSVAYNVPLDINQLAPFFEIPNSYQQDFLIKVNNLIGQTYFGELLKNIPADKIKELANSISITNKLFSATLSRVHITPTYEMVKDHIGEYLDSDQEILRKVGMELISDFPDQYLLQNHQLINGYCFSSYAEVREGIQPAIGRLINLDENFKQSLLHTVLQVLTEAELYEGVHESSYQVLKQYYGEDLQEVNQDGIITLVLSKYEFAQKLGTPMFHKKLKLNDLTMLQLVSLSTSDVKEVRESLHVYFKSNPARVNYELEDALRIFNTDWQDAREWAYTYFSEHIKPQNWTVKTLLYVCDHTKKDVEAFGRKMVTTHFREEDGLQLLIKLQEHPTKTMQFFTTNYLNTYAKDTPEVILKLELFFKTILFSINSNTAAKARVFTFLEKESVKDEKVAHMTIRILDSILATKTIKDKSRCIDLILSINEVFSHIETPLTIKTT